MAIIFISHFFVFVVGLCLGSFATALAERIPNKEKIINARSKCPECQKDLKWHELFPVFSWVFQRGKCGCSRSKISMHYPLTELACGAALLFAFLFIGLDFNLIPVALAVPVLAALFIIDWKKMILPNVLVFTLFLLGLGHLLLLFLDGVPLSLIFLDYVLLGAFLYAGLVWASSLFIGFLKKKEALGMGDIKFFFVAGLWLGFPLLPAFLMLSGLFGIVIALIWRSIYKSERFPFGPALILSFFSCLMLFWYDKGEGTILF